MKNWKGKLMKNWKVKKKLLVSFGLVFLMMAIIGGIGFFGMNMVKNQVDLFQERTLPNTEDVWTMRQEMISVQRYMLLALQSDEMAETQINLESANRDVENLFATYENYLTNYRVDESKITELDGKLQSMKQARVELIDLLMQNTEKSKEQVYVKFVNEFKPLQDGTAELLKDIGSEQTAMAEEGAVQATNIFRIAIMVLIAIFLAAVAISVVIVRVLINNINTPLKEIEKAANALYEGDFSVDIDYESKDEFGVTCQTMRDSFNELKRVIGEIREGLGEMAEGNFSVYPSETFKGELAEIEKSIINLLEKLNFAFGDIKRSGDEINMGAEQVAGGSQALAQGATEQASSVEELSASLTEVSRQIKDNSENARKANELAVDSGRATNNTLSDMQDMLNSMNEISTTSENISKVIKVIDDIAFQTNILALNAAVEAARAGTAGKGFAVVADEVRNLAGKSSEAAKETTALIESSINAVATGEQIARKAYDEFEKVSEMVNNVVDTVNEISEASEHQADGISQITTGVEQISSVVQTNSATSEESAAAAEELSSQANVLNNLVSQFRLKDDLEKFDNNMDV